MAQALGAALRVAAAGLGKGYNPQFPATFANLNKDIKNGIS